METSTITRKGQVTIPARLRRRLNLEQGTLVAFSEEGDHLILRPVESDVEASFGLIQASRSVSLEEMEAAIRRRGRE